MKTLIFILVCMGCLVGCERESSSENKTTIHGKTIETYIIDSCEYIGYIRGSNSDVLTHKGNCKYCRERNKPQNGLVYGGTVTNFTGTPVYTIAVDSLGNIIGTASGKIQLPHYGIPETSDQSLSLPAGKVKLGGVIESNTTIKSKWTDAERLAPKESSFPKPEVRPQWRDASKAKIGKITFNGDAGSQTGTEAYAIALDSLGNLIEDLCDHIFSKAMNISDSSRNTCMKCKRYFPR